MNDVTDVRAMLVDAATRIFADHCNQPLVEAAKRTGWSESLWRVLEDAQIPLISVPEGLGGAGGTLGDLAAVLRIAGRHSAPVPLAETGMLAGWLLAGAGMPVPAGPLAAAPLHPCDRVELVRDGEAWRLSAEVARMPWARIASRLVLLADCAQGARVVSVDPAACEIAPGSNLAWEPRDRVRADGVRIDAADVGTPAADANRETLRLRGALARAVLMVGALDHCLALSLAHAKTRVQFGRPIAKFQAIQQELARFAEEVAAATAAALSAVGAVERGAPGIAVAAAKVRAGEAASTGAAIAHQVHAAIGVTEEYALHHATLRLQAWRSECGSETAWAESLGADILAAGAERLWPTLTGTS